jgi:succinate dehydrogenase / fumarate reductase cytochrome b subunit
MSELSKKRPEFRNINAFKDLTTYRLPLAGWVSIMHRISGLMMFVLLPFIVWVFDRSVTSSLSYEQLTRAFDSGTGIYGAWFLKLVSLGLIWAYMHHLFAGVRHLYMDRTHKVDKAFGKSSAMATLVVSLGLTVILAAKLFGVY